MVDVSVVLFLASCAGMPRYTRCMYMAHACFYVCCSECGGGLWECFLCRRPLLKIVCFSLGVLKYVVCFSKGYDRCCVLLFVL